MEVFVLVFWFALVGFVIAAIARLWFVDSQPVGGRKHPS
jgi:hypothetical protein